MEPIHQLLIGASPGDAITSMAFRIRDRFRRTTQSNIYAAFIDSALSEEVFPVQDLYSSRSRCTLIYHASYGLKRITQFLVDFRGSLVLNYHNITPPEFFEAIDPEFAEGLRWGRRELELIRPNVVVAVADSTFNANELLDLGYRDVLVCPAGVTHDRLKTLTRDIRLSNFFKSKFPNGFVVTLSQLLPHKSIHELVAATHYARNVLDLRIGLVIVGVERSSMYATALRDFAFDLLGEECHFTGRLNDRQVGTLLQDALSYVSLSRHEGLSLPLIEAMAMGTPAVIRETGALRETAGSGACVLNCSAGPVEFADSLLDVLCSTDLRAKLVHRGLLRSEDFSHDRVLDRYENHLDGVLA
jgi:glycosyltransferase involved in cell wall biosynthesis